MKTDALKVALDRLYLDFDRGARISDPIERVRPFRDPADREVVGFLAAGLAFGRVASIMASIDAVLAPMGPSPAAFVRRFDPGTDAPRFETFVHRWTKGRDVAGVLWILRHMLETSGSIEQFFLDGDDSRAEDIGPGLESFCARARAVDLSPIYGTPPASPGAHGLFARPSSGSACKRLNLFLRWMVRHDAIDLGVWPRVSRARLIVPLDVHVLRVGRCLGLTRRSSPGWPMAADITRALRAIDPVDPVRYDFALCHVGMLGLCGFRQAAANSRCPLRGACRPGRRTRRASLPPSGRR
ncbi:MAG: TIGR02757 family protein [Vicinamibacterales bacterium]|nr:TIGR02757 family protein [Vicinamibacterales bacterium]